MIEGRRLEATLEDRLIQAGVSVEDREIDLGAFEEWKANFPSVVGYFHRFAEYTTEKCLETYLVCQALAPQPQHTVLDLGSQDCPLAPELAKRGISAYRLDRIYPRGMHGTDIGADFTATGLPHAFADRIILQDALHILPGLSDISAIREICRLLKPGGYAVIVPLHLAKEHTNIVNRPWSPVDRGAKRQLQWRDRRWGVRFTRYYSPENFEARIIQSLPQGVNATIVHYRNLDEVRERYSGPVYVKFMLVLTSPK